MPDNPFNRRAAEQYRDPAAFLPVVSPEPITAFLRNRPLLDRLVVILGTPGSGKTMLARIVEYSNVAALLRIDDGEYRHIRDALTQCGVLRQGEPAVVAARVPLEVDYRDIWELGYPPELKARLTQSLIQARAVMAWLDQLVHRGGFDLDDLRVIPSEGQSAALDAIGGPTAKNVRARAVEIEASVYKVAAALVPPVVDQIGAAGDAYAPFLAIAAIEVPASADLRRLQPLAVLDDAHALHPAQYTAIEKWLTTRTMPVARWILTRLDQLDPAETLLSADDRPPVSLDRNRDITVVSFQGEIANRAAAERTFKTLAGQMADRYLAQMPVFQSRQIRHFEALLETAAPRPTQNQLKEMATRVERYAREKTIPAVRVAKFRGEASEYCAANLADEPGLEDVVLMLLLARYADRVKQIGLFDAAQIEEDPDPNRPIIANASIAEAARIRLLHSNKRPYFYGLQKLIEVSSLNAEQFLQLAGQLVSYAEVQAIRNRPLRLDASTQQRLLQERASEIVDRQWAFPFSSRVRALVARIADICREETLRDTAPLGGGARGIGIETSEFQRAIRDELVRSTLHYGVAYKALHIETANSKGKDFYLIQLGGLLLLKYGLTTKRGGYVPTPASVIVEIVKGTGA